ncbi:MAG: Gfo/Idh/MocA family oxidoreductase, partial [Planctomycetes bacterium]|nr:Gfo/Idh/MocA family oxidoreductase [Planctomycetota bacterium]
MSKKGRIGIGAIGCGGMGRSVISKLLKQDERFELVAICDPDEGAIRQTREMAKEVRVIHDYRKLVEDKEVDFVMIASWNVQHKDHLVATVQAGKDLFCQKPVATNFQDAMTMRKELGKSGRTCTIGFTLRYSPHYRKIKALIDQGSIGRVISMEFNETLDFNHGGYIMGDWRRLEANAGTHLLEKCCHDIDLVNWMLDSHPVKAASFGGTNFFTPENLHHQDRIGPNKDGKPAFMSWGGAINLNPFTSDKDIIDNQVAIMEYEGGIRASFHANCQAGIPERRMY